MKHLALLAFGLSLLAGCKTDAGESAVASNEAALETVGAKDFQNSDWSVTQPDGGDGLSVTVTLKLAATDGKLTVVAGGESQGVAVASFRDATAAEIKQLKENSDEAIPEDEMGFTSVEYQHAVALVDKDGKLLKIVPIVPSNHRLYFPPVGVMTKGGKA